MNQSKASSLRKMTIGAVVALGATIIFATSTACSVQVTPTCTPDLGACAADTDCCTGICAGDGLCGCVDEGQTGCAADSDCCSASDICAGGACVPASTCANPGGLADGSSCSADTDCCTGVCSTGDNTCGCVVTNSTGCAIDSDCCVTTDSCINGVCQ